MQFLRNVLSWLDAKFWWGAFFTALISVLAFAPESNFSNRIRELFYTLWDSYVASWEANPIIVAIFSVIFIGVLYDLVFGGQPKIKQKFNNDEIELIRKQNTEERHLNIIYNIYGAHKHSSRLAILLATMTLLFGYMLVE